MELFEVPVVAAVLAACAVVLNISLRLFAVGFIPEGRRPSSGAAWLVLILFVPVIGFLLFLLLGGTSVGRLRSHRQTHALELLRERIAEVGDVQVPFDAPPYLGPTLTLGRRLGALPPVPVSEVTMHSDYEESIRAMTAMVGNARQWVHIEFYIMAWDETTSDLFDALVAATHRGVCVRLLFDHLGTRGLPSYRELVRRLARTSIEWHPMLPFNPLKGQLRRPDLRNHRKILVVDGEAALTGSQNLVEASYHDPGNRRSGRRWVELTATVAGPLARALDAVFATDWYTETGELIDPGRTASETSPRPDPDSATIAPGIGQVVPSGPGVVAENNLRLFTTLMYGASRKIAITSPYFVPDESLLYAITTAAQRGVAVELFVSGQGDQFMVHHAQCSYYRALLEVGVTIWQYPAPMVLHAKHLSIDDDVVVLGSSNMDMRSFALDYEVSLVLTGPTAVGQMHQVEEQYRQLSTILTLDEWDRRPRRQRYLDNVMRLTAALQ